MEENENVFTEYDFSDHPTKDDLQDVIEHAVASGFRDIDDTLQLLETDLTEIIPAEGEATADDVYAWLNENYKAPDNQDTLDAITALSDRVDALALGVDLLADAYAGNFSSSMLDYFDRISYQVPIFSDYVAYRSGQYEYLMYWGDLDLNNGVIAGDELHRVRIDTRNLNSMGYLWSVSDNQSVSLSPGQEIVYSNLGYYPRLARDGDFPAYLGLFLGVMVAIGLFVHSIVKFTLRNGCVTDG